MAMTGWRRTLRNSHGPEELLDVKLPDHDSRGGRWLSCGLAVVLLLFCFSFFLLDSSKARNNIYYALFLLPAAIFSYSVASVLLRTAGVRFLLVFFTGSAVAEILGGDGVLQAAKHAGYLVALLFGLAIAQRERRFFRAVQLAGFSFVTLMAGIAIFLWLSAFQATGAWIRVELYAAASNPVHASLMILLGWLAFWLNYGLPALLQRGRVAYFAGFGLMLGFAFLICLVFKSRSAVLGLSFVILAWLALGPERRVGVFLVVGGALAVWALGGYEGLLERGVSFRSAIWADGLQRLDTSCSWLVGCERDDGYLFLGQFEHAHSAYLSILIDNGLLGVSTFLAFACGYFALGLKTRSPWFIVSLLGWGGVIASSNGLIDSPRPLWIYFWLPTMLALLDFERYSSLPRRGAPPVRTSLIGGD